MSRRNIYVLIDCDDQTCGDCEFCQPCGNVAGHSHFCVLHGTHLESKGDQALRDKLNENP